MAADYNNGVYLGLLTYFGSGYTGQYLYGPTYSEAIAGMAGLFPEIESIGLDSDIFANGITFYYPNYGSPTDTVTFPGQTMPVIPEVIPNQKVMQSGSGKFSIYDSPFKNRIYPIWLGPNIDMGKRSRMYNFVHNIVKDSMRTFEISDESPVIYTVRFTPDVFNWPMESWVRWNIAVRMYIISQWTPA